MSKTIGRMFFVMMLAAMLCGCASGPSYSDTIAKQPALGPGKGRIYFYREGNFTGSAIQPHVTMNDQTVGKSVPGGFFYLDRPAGKIEVSCASEGNQYLAFMLTEGETRYVRTLIIAGLGIGHVLPVLEDETTAMPVLRGCRYIGE